MAACVILRKINNEKIEVYDLGTASAFNLKTLVPNKPNIWYDSITANDFYYKTSSGSGTAGTGTREGYSTLSRSWTKSYSNYTLTLNYSANIFLVKY